VRETVVGLRDTIMNYDYETSLQVQNSFRDMRNSAKVVVLLRTLILNSSSLTGFLLNIPGSQDFRSLSGSYAVLQIMKQIGLQHSITLSSLCNLSRMFYARNTGWWMLPDLLYLQVKSITQIHFLGFQRNR
jgi:hypothetical protein